MFRTSTILINLALLGVVHSTKIKNVREVVTAEEAAKLHEKAEAAAKALMASAAEARKHAHGDGSDRFANRLEESMLDLQEMDHENKEKAKARHAQHEKENQALHAKFEKERQEMHEKFEREKAERKKSHDKLEKELEELKAEMNSRHEKERQQLHGHHKRQNDQHARQFKEGLVDKSVVVSDSKPSSSQSTDTTEDSGLSRDAFGVVVVVGVLVGLLLLCKSGVDPSVQIPGLGRVNPVKWMNIFSSKGRSDNSYIYLKKGASVPLRSASTSGNYGGFAI